MYCPLLNGEIELTKKEAVFSWQHPLKSFSGTSMCVLNIRAWNVHLEHFLSDKIYQSYPSLLCFTETNISDRSVEHID